MHSNFRILAAVSSKCQHLADAAKVTLGPKGCNVVIDKPFGAQCIIEDGVSVARKLICRTGSRTWPRIFATLAAQAELPYDLSIDSTAVRAHRS